MFHRVVFVYVVIYITCAAEVTGLYDGPSGVRAIMSAKEFDAQVINNEVCALSRTWQQKF